MTITKTVDASIKNIHGASRASKGQNIKLKHQQKKTDRNRNNLSKKKKEKNFKRPPSERRK